MKIACVYHSIDLDGWMSAAIVKHWFNHSYLIRSDAIHEIDFIGYNYGQPIIDLSEYDKVIMCDITYPKNEMEKLFDRLEDEFIWIDHHKSAIDDMFINGERSIHPMGFQATNFAACELTWKYFFPNEQMPEIVRLLGRYDCFGHKGTDEEKIVLEFQYGARSYITDFESAYEKLNVCLKGEFSENRLLDSIAIDGEAIYNYLCTDALNIYNSKISIDIMEATNIDSDIANIKNIIPRRFACVNKERFNPINFGIDYHKDDYDGFACFWYNNGKWNFSLYNDNGLVDCSVIAKQFGGGGHKGASGFIVYNIDEFINNYKSE